MQVGGSALRMEADAFRHALEQSPALQKLLLRFVQAFHLQTAQTAACNGSHSVGRRLARWLLMCHDRLDGDELPLTHEFIAVMLGVRRPGVTEALQMLEASKPSGPRGATSSCSTVGKLEEVAGDGYGGPEAEYQASDRTPALGWRGLRIASVLITAYWTSCRNSVLRGHEGGEVPSPHDWNCSSVAPPRQGRRHGWRRHALRRGRVRIRLRGANDLSGPRRESRRRAGTTRPRVGHGIGPAALACHGR